MTSAPGKSQATNNSITAAKPRGATDGLNRTASLSDRFTVLKSTGATEDSEFYLARGRGSEELITLRILSDSAAQDQTRLKLFYAEARAAARLSHSNTIKTSEATCFGSVHYCVLEQKDGVESLRSLLDQTGWFDIPRALTIARQMIAAIEHAHSKGVWHLRLRPEEILIKPDGEVILTGFGIDSTDELAWAQGERSRTCPVRYISPEQIEGSRVDHRADLYLLGVLLFEMLTDRVPFDAQDPDSIRQKHLTRDPEPPSVYREGIPEPLSDLVMNLIEKNPDERIRKVASYESLLNRLLEIEQADRLINDEPIEETDAGLPVNDFLPFGLQLENETVIDAEVIEWDERDDALVDTKQSTAIIPAQDFSIIDSSNQPAELVLRSLSGREDFEPPTISAMDLPYDQGLNHTRQIETAHRELLLPEAVPSEAEAESALSVRRVTPMVVEVEGVSKASRIRRAVMIAAGIILIAWPIVLIERSRSSSTNSTTRPAAANSNQSQPAASPVQEQSATQAGLDKSASTAGEKKASAPSSNVNRIRSSGPVKRVRKSQNRSRRSSRAQRLRRYRR